MTHPARLFSSLCVIFALNFTVISLVKAQDIVSEKETEQIEFASGLFERGLYDMAAAEYKEFINTYGKSNLLTEAHFGMAESLFFSKKYPEAINAFNNVITLQGSADKIAVSYLRIAQSYDELKDFQNALKAFSAANTADIPEKFSQTFFYSYAKTLRTVGEQKKAIEYLEKAAQVKAEEQETAAVLFDLAELYGKSGKDPEGLRTYEKIYNDSSDSKIKSLSLYKKGELYFQTGKFKEAYQTFNSVLKDHSTELIAKEAVKGLLLSLYELKQYPEITNVYENQSGSIPLSPDNFNVLFAAADSYLMQDNYEKAFSLWNEIIKLTLPDDERRLVLLKQAETLIRSGKATDISGFLEKHSSDLKGAQDKMMYLNAEALYEAKNYAAAAESYKKFMTDFPQSPLLPDALYGLAYSMKKMDKDQESADAFADFVSKTSDSERKEEALYNTVLLNAKLDRTAEVIAYSEAYLKEFTNGRYLKEIMFLSGTFSQKNGDHKRALEIYENYLGSFGDDDRKDDVLFLAAYNAQQLGDIKKAAFLYERTVEEAGKKEIVFSALKNLGLIAMDEGDHEKAAVFFDRMIKEFGEKDISNDIYAWLAERYHKSKEFEKIISLLDSAAKRSVPVKDTALFYFSGEAMRETGKCDKALEIYEEAIVLGGPMQDYSGASLIGKAKCYRDQGRFDEAKNELEKILAIFTNDDTMMMRARFELGEVEKAAGRLEEAYKYYMLVAVLYADDLYSAESLFNAAEIFEKLGKKEEAVKAYSEIVERYPTSKRAEAAIQKLGKDSL